MAFVMFPPSPLIWILELPPRFILLPSLSWHWHFWRCQAPCLVYCPSIWISLVVSSWLDSEYVSLARIQSMYYRWCVDERFGLGKGENASVARYKHVTHDMWRNCWGQGPERWVRVLQSRMPVVPTLPSSSLSSDIIPSRPRPRLAGLSQVQLQRTPPPQPNPCFHLRGVLPSLIKYLFCLLSLTSAIIHGEIFISTWLLYLNYLKIKNNKQTRRVAKAANEVRGHWYANVVIKIGGPTPELCHSSFQIRANLY